MRAEDRLSFVLHPDLAAAVHEVADDSGFRPRVQDPDVCLHCRRHQCISVCAVAAFTTTDEGRIALDAERCVGSGACLVACYEFRNLTWVR